MSEEILVGTESSYFANASGNYFYLQKYTAVASGIGTIFKVRANASGNVKVAVYADNAGEPGNLITSMDIGQAVVSGWNDLSFTDTSITSGIDYWLAFNCSVTGAVANSSVGATTRRKSVTYSSFSFPDPAGSGFTTSTYGNSIAIWKVTPPAITDCEDEDIEEGEAVDLTGTDLSGTTVTLELGDAATYGTCTIKTTQTINSNDGSTMNFTAVKGSLDYGTNYLYVNRDGQTSYGYAINLYAELDITSASSSLLTGFTGNTVTGAHYGATQGASKLYLCDQADALGLNVEQTIEAWSDTSITFTAVKDGLSVGTAYLVISRNDATLGDTAARLSAGYEVTLADPPTRLSFKHFLENGAGTMAHLWHVAGYPWAVTDSQELVDALSDTGNTMVQLARKRLFGTNEIALVGGTAIPAYDVPIFATLKKDFGKVKFEIDESNGLMKGGSWSVKIEDKDLGHTWAHAVSGDEIFGLEGLHRVANVKASDVHGWGYLRENFVRQATGFEQLEIAVEEQSPGYLYDRIDGLTTSEYKVLWMNHEAVAVSSIASGTAPEYVIQAAERGLYRSRKQDHYTDALKGLNPIIADVPGDIVGHYCWLYAIPLVNGQLVLTQGNIPLIVEELRGLVSPNMYSDNGITYVSVREDLAALERTVNVEMSRAAETGMKGFFFSRGDSPAGSSDNDEDNEVRIELIQKMQAPHLIIREFSYSYKALADEYKADIAAAETLADTLIAQETARLNLVSRTQIGMMERYIWLCPKNSTVFFETVDEVIAALNWELSKLRHGLEGENSEDVELTHSWHVATINNRYGLVSNDETEDREYLKNYIVEGDWASQQALHGYITGPLAWVFALGNTVGNPGTTIYDLIKSTSENNRIKGYSRLETLSPDESLISIIPWQNAISQTCWMVPADSKMGFWENIVWESRYSNIFNEYLKEFGMEIAKPRYYHGWNWVEHPASWASDFGIALYTNNNWRIFIDSYVDTESFVDGDIIFIGDGKRFPRLTGTIDEVIPLDGYDKINEIVLDPNFVFSENSALFPHGTSLFYLPLLEVIGNEEVENLDELDPHRLRKSMTIETLQPSLVFRSILGETIGGVNIANEIQVATCPFFTTVEDFVSAIDWASLDYLPRLYGQNYIAPLGGGDSVKGILKNELLFHRAHMTREFDSTYLMWRYRFTPIAPINASMALMGGFHLDGNKALTGPPDESHGIGELYNAIALKVGDIETKIQQLNSPIIGTDERRTLKVEPEVSRIPLYDIMNDGIQTEDLVAAFRPLLDAISRPAVIQTKGTTLFQYLFPVGREIRVTDITARRPFTHRLGLDVEPAKVMGSSWEWKKCQGTITYSLGNSHSSAQYGYAPACMLEAGNFSKAVGSWSGTANDHEFGDHCKDVYYFDCIDIGDAGNPSSRACTCGDYAVWAIEIGTPGWTPLPFTCSVDIDTDVITLTGDVTDIDEGKTYVIVFRPWDDLEPCQKVWVTHADDSNTIGAAALPANRWE